MIVYEIHRSVIQNPYSSDSFTVRRHELMEDVESNSTLLCLNPHSFGETGTGKVASLSATVFARFKESVVFDDEPRRDSLGDMHLASSGLHFLFANRLVSDIGITNGFSLLLETSTGFPQVDKFLCPCLIRSRGPGSRQNLLRSSRIGPIWDQQFLVALIRVVTLTVRASDLGSMLDPIFGSNQDPDRSVAQGLRPRFHAGSDFRFEPGERDLLVLTRILSDSDRTPTDLMISRVDRRALNSWE
ncbi:unnamed protein product [Caenorhabditis auriculariae]|uniref:Uncharacterized protein n=1 Tax=Caenorhabditis auriculariae TaxID=2777116 RepID=A0A8S1I0F6_9PELO|nr:unnamed protein product [Caenorhabditis auriculariae]